MGSIAETLGERLFTDVVTEALDEMTGRSNRKWAVILVAAIAGAIITAAITRRRRRDDKAVIARGPAGST